MNVSYIIPVLNSHEVVRRQILYWGKMQLPDDIEIIIMDDGSDPPLEFDTEVVTIYRTGETRPWTSSIARNRGAEIAKGRTLLMLDIDYIVPKRVIMELREFTGQRRNFRREFGVLDADGNLTQDVSVLLDYGLEPGRYRRRGVKISHHPNIYAMHRDVYFALGGYNEDLVLRRQYPQGEDNLFKRRWWKWVQEGKGDTDPLNPVVYMFPHGQFCGDVDYNPHNLFHNLSRKNRTNVFWQRQLAREQKP